MSRFPLSGGSPPIGSDPTGDGCRRPTTRASASCAGWWCSNTLSTAAAGIEPVGVLLGGAQPGRQGGLVLRGRDRRPQAALDWRNFGVVGEKAALRVAVGGGHRRLPRLVEEARYDQADGEVVRPDHLGVCHAAGPDALPQGPWQEGLVDQEGVHPVSRRLEREVMSSTPPAVDLRTPQASRPARKSSVALLVAAFM